MAMREFPGQASLNEYSLRMTKLYARLRDTTNIEYHSIRPCNLSIFHEKETKIYARYRRIVQQ